MLCLACDSTSRGILSTLQTVLTELIVTQAVDQLQETVLPYLMYKWRKYGMNTDERLQHQIDKEAKKDPYEVSCVAILFTCS